VVCSIFAHQPPNRRFEKLKRSVLHDFNLCAFAPLPEIFLCVNGSRSVRGVERDVIVDFDSHRSWLTGLAIDFAAPAETVEHARTAG
jgi:hypothetical protein